MAAHDRPIARSARAARISARRSDPLWRRGNGLGIAGLALLAALLIAGCRAGIGAPSPTPTILPGVPSPTLSPPATTPLPSAASPTEPPVSSTPSPFASPRATPVGTVVVDFQASRFAVPPDLLGAGDSPLLERSERARTAFTAGGFQVVRLDGELPAVFARACATPCWEAIDNHLRTLDHVLLILDYTPDWLQPSPNPCQALGAVANHAPPTDVGRWAALGAAYVHHLDQTFPGKVIGYEIWNEPDSPRFLCAPDEEARFRIYRDLFTATAAALRAQARRDGVPVRIWGPALANPLTHRQSFLVPFLADPAVRGNLDGISYHTYQYGYDPAVDWPTLLRLTRDSTRGVTATFVAIARAVAESGRSLPIAITEYNTSAGPYEDGTGRVISCCNNDPTFAPLWNALFVADTLAGVYQGAPAPPAHLLYFTSSFPAAPGRGGACLFGVLDSLHDCATTPATAIVPYPQWYAYRLLASPDFLGLADHATLVDTPPVGPPGLALLAFVTPGRESLLLLNLHPTAVGPLRLVFQHERLGKRPPTAYRVSADGLSPVPIAGEPDGWEVTLPGSSVTGLVFRAG